MINKKGKLVSEVQKNSSNLSHAKNIDYYYLHNVGLELKNQEIKKAHLRYEEEHARYNNLSDFIPVGYFILNKQGVILETNETGANLLGFLKNNIINKNLLRYVAPNFQHLYLDHIQRVHDSRSTKVCKLKFVKKSGSLFFAQLDTKIIVNPATNQDYLITVIKDINEEITHDQSVFPDNQEKLVPADAATETAMEKFAEIVIHELNHPLAVINNYLYGCIKHLQGESYQKKDVIQALKRAYDQSHRITDIILRMKNFTFKGVMQFEKVNVDKLMKDAIALIRHEISSTYPVRIIYYPIDSTIEMVLDKVHIEQVIINIARNAIEAMRDFDTSEPKLTIEIHQLTTNQIQISIADNGPSISEDNLHQLFKPYFTTKSYGAGLGLALSKKIIEAHGGILDAEVLPEGGTCIKFTLLNRDPYIKTH